MAGPTDLGRPGSPSPRLLFVVGARRSGTNWLQGLLGVHPQVGVVPSETYLLYSLNDLAGRFQHGLLRSPNTGATYLPREELIDWFRQLCDRAFDLQRDEYAGPDQVLVERTPWHAMCVDLIGEVYPQAPILHLIRDGRDVVASLLRQPWGPTTAQDAAAEWVQTVRTARAQAPPRYQEVRYEDLVADPVGVMTSVFSSVGLPVDPDVLDAVARLAPQPVNRSYGLATSTATWREHLTADQLAAVEAVAGDLLVELGYPLAVPVAAEPADSGTAPPSTGGRQRLRRIVGSRRPPRAAAEPATVEPLVAPAPITLTNGQRLPSVRGDERQWVIDRFLAALSTGDARWIAGMLSPQAEIRLHSEAAGGERFGPGSDPLVAAQALVNHARPFGTQVRGDLYAAHPAHTVIWTHEADGALTHAVLVVTIDRDDTLIGLDSYQLSAVG